MTGHPILRAVAVAASAALLVTALAVPAAAGGDKVTICHEPGTPAEKTMYLPPRAVDAHLGHGDTLGECDEPIGTDVCEALEFYGNAYEERGGEVTDVVFKGDEKIEFHGGTDSPVSAPVSFRITLGSKQKVIPSTCEPVGGGGLQCLFYYELPAPGWGKWPPKSPTDLSWWTTGGEVLDQWVTCTRE